MTAYHDQLIVRLGDTVIQTLIPSAPVITIGRSPSNTLELPHRSVSRHHAEIRIDAGGMAIIDLDSANGVQVDGKRLPARDVCQLRRGAHVQIGPYTLTCLDANGQEIDEARAFEEMTVLEARPDLRIAIDPRRRQREAAEIIESEYFQQLQKESQRLRSKD